MRAHTDVGVCSGFTLIEVMWTVLVFGVIAGTSVTGVRGWTNAREHTGTAAGIQSVLREAQQRAVTEGRAMCVDFDVAAQTYGMYRDACGDLDRALLQGPLRTDGRHVRIASPTFVDSSGTGTGVTFRPRGTASAGSVQVVRVGSSKVWTVSVEGLSGRVSRA